MRVALRERWGGSSERCQRPRPASAVDLSNRHARMRPTDGVMPRAPSRALLFRPRGRGYRGREGRSRSGGRRAVEAPDASAPAPRRPCTRGHAQSAVLVAEHGIAEDDGPRSLEPERDLVLARGVDGAHILKLTAADARPSRFVAAARLCPRPCEVDRQLPAASMSSRLGHNDWGTSASTRTHALRLACSTGRRHEGLVDVVSGTSTGCGVTKRPAGRMSSITGPCATRRPVEIPLPPHDPANELDQFIAGEQPRRGLWHPQRRTARGASVLE